MSQTEFHRSATPKARLATVLVIALSISLSILQAGCGRPHGPGGPPQGGAPEVGVVTVQPERVVLTTELPGRVSAYLVSEVRPQVSGLILKRLFTEGQVVRAGDVLYEIDPAMYKAAYDQAKAAVAMAEANLPAIRSRAERFEGLLEIHAVGQQEYDDASAALKQAEAALAAAKAASETARINLSYTPVKAPISGRIGKSGITVGALVTAHQPVSLATIQTLDPVYVDLTQSTTELFRLRRRLQNGVLDHPGEAQNEVELILEDDTPYPMKGAFRFRDVTVDPSTGSVILRVVFPNPDRILLPGMFVRARVKEGVKEEAILIPQQGVSRDPKGKPFALVVNASGEAEMRRLELDRAIGDKWLVSAGLAPGDRLIVEGQQRVRPGVAVEVVPFSEDEARPTAPDDTPPSTSESD
ncbi:MAG: efflux transporter periplasmic adaptor subunit [Verrucomicrobia bacterium]|nr:MAG: efflux transporter periplasmic adaptor subunit [Verrucomicrobiota bacterium]